MSSFLKKHHIPWMRTGRWYEAFIESDGSAHTLVKSDIEESHILSGRLYFPHDLNVSHVYMDIHNVEFDSGTVASNSDLTLSNNGATYITLPAAKAYDYMHVYVYGVRR